LNLFEIAAIVDGEFVLRPESSALGQRVEEREIHEAKRSLLMVSADDPGVELANPFDDCIRIRPIPHDVAAAQNLIILTGGVLQHGVERFQV
jgi:hypothetical protein